MMIIGLYQVVPRSKRKQMINNTITMMPPKAQEVFYQDVIRKQGAQTYRVSLLSAISNLEMSWPVRSFQCNHIQCFDYSQIIKFINRSKPSNPRIPKKYRSQSKLFPLNMLNSSSAKTKIINKESNRRKRTGKIIECPVCNVNIKGLYVDLIMQQKIQENKINNERPEMIIQRKPNQFHNKSI